MEVNIFNMGDVQWFSGSNYFQKYMGDVQWFSGSARLEIEGSLVQDSLEALCCVLEQDTLSSTGSSQETPKITENLLTGMHSINTKKIKVYVVVHKCTYKNCLTEAFTNC